MRVENCPYDLYILKVWRSKTMKIRERLQKNGFQHAMFSFNNLLEPKVWTRNDREPVKMYRFGGQKVNGVLMKDSSQTECL